jgi:hypothetical protein
MALEDVFAFGTQLGHRDVLSNIRKTNICDECGVENHTLRMCDGCFPVAVGQSFPIDAIGRQHACHLSSVCDKCIILPLKKRQAAFKGESLHFIPKGMTQDDDRIFSCAFVARKFLLTLTSSGFKM